MRVISRDLISIFLCFSCRLSKFDFAIFALFVPGPWLCNAPVALASHFGGFQMPNVWSCRPVGVGGGGFLRGFLAVGMPGMG